MIADAMCLDPCVERDHARRRRDLFDPMAARGDGLGMPAQLIDLYEDAHAALAEPHDVLDEPPEYVAQDTDEAGGTADRGERLLVVSALCGEVLSQTVERGEQLLGRIADQRSRAHQVRLHTCESCVE